MEVKADMVKTLREKSGAGILDCRNALKETAGDIEEAITYLRKKGMAKADKKGDRTTGDGAIGNYIHPGSKIGVLVKLNCETDFVAKNDEFQGLLKDIAMHIAAAQPRFTSRDDVTENILQKEREIYTAQAKESGKPDKVIDKIVDGKMSKFYEETCLLDQPFVKDTGINIQDLIKQKIATLGENITVGGFTRMEITK